MSGGPGPALALANALLSTGAVACMVLGYRAIRRRRITRHRNLMLTGVGLSAAFMTLFLVRFIVFGFRPFGGTGVWRVLYYVILLSHEPLAVINVPLVVIAAVLGLLHSRAHPEVARVALWVWLATAVTGVILYVLLYLLPLG